MICEAKLSMDQCEITKCVIQLDTCLAGHMELFIICICGSDTMALGLLNLAWSGEKHLPIKITLVDVYTGIVNLPESVFYLGNIFCF